MGVALARAEVKVPVALDTLDRQAESFWKQLELVCKENDIAKVVIGLPRGLDGQETRQTENTRRFASEIKKHMNLPIVWQDEAVTSLKAREILTSSGKNFNKQDVDAVAATLILGDYLSAERSK